MYIGDYETMQELILEMLVPYDEDVPVGEFKVTTDLSEDHIILPGFVTASGEGMWSWYVGYSEDGYDLTGQAPIVDGTVTITDNGDESYSVVCDLVDDLGNKITGECASYFEVAGPYYRKAANANAPVKAKAPLKHHIR